MAERKYKTSGRQHIMEYLIEHKDRGVSALDIYSYLEEKGSRVNITTIYRNLDKLVKDGDVMKYASEQGEKCTYQYTERKTECHNHLHLKCTVCGGVIHLDCGFMKEFGRHIEEHHKFVIQCQNSMIYGVCEHCRS